MFYSRNVTCNEIYIIIYHGLEHASQGFFVKTKSKVSRLHFRAKYCDQNALPRITNCQTEL